MTTKPTSVYPNLKLIVAHASNHVIGLNGHMPWHIPSDLKQFKRLTMNCPIIMGRHTWDSIISRLGHALPDRRSIVLTRNTHWTTKEATVVHTIESAILACEHSSTAWVIGGAQIYAQFLACPLLTACYITEIKAEFEGDAWFPQLDFNVWKMISKTKNPPEPSNYLSFDTVIYHRMNPVLK